MAHLGQSSSPFQDSRKEQNYLAYLYSNFAYKTLWFSKRPKNFTSCPRKATPEE
jgi:hypothetical protein